MYNATVECPLSFQILTNPRIAPCGHIFSNDAILAWLRNGSTNFCPLCSKYLSESDLRPDNTLSSDIDRVKQLENLKTPSQTELTAPVQLILDHADIDELKRISASAESLKDKKNKVKPSSSSSLLSPAASSSAAAIVTESSPVKSPAAQSSAATSNTPTFRVGDRLLSTGTFSSDGLSLVPGTEVIVLIPYAENTYVSLADNQNIQGLVPTSILTTTSNASTTHQLANTSNSATSDSSSSSDDDTPNNAAITINSYQTVYAPFTGEADGEVTVAVGENVYLEEEQDGWVKVRALSGTGWVPRYCLVSN
mmetsp:Transcript_9107/g.13772  ORF Transcript_9107/g.13772 Transcript_9107/m.13772 type:complete len:309 (+) Transcript_9107:36-962(+)